jgi:hypothetical protein
MTVPFLGTDAAIPAVACPSREAPVVDCLSPMMPDLLGHLPNEPLFQPIRCCNPSLLRPSGLQ